MSCVTKTTGVPAFSAVRVEQAGDHLLVREVEREQRLVGEEERRVGDERLRDPEPLLLAAREAPDRRVGVRRRAHGVERAVEPVRVGRREPGERPSGARRGRAARDRGRAARGHGRRCAAAGRSRRASARSAAACPSIAHRARRGLEEAEQDAQERGLARAVRAEHREQLAALELEVRGSPKAPARRSGATGRSTETTLISRALARARGSAELPLLEAEAGGQGLGDAYNRDARRGRRARGRVP